MTDLNNARVLIAGTHSGCGKTTVTVAIIAALRARGVAVSAFKCGPDYIDPMFHRRALGVAAHNLDPFFSTHEQLAAAVASQGAGSLAVIEGVMGYYDGVGTTTRASTYEVAQATKTPVVLVIDASGMAASVGAVLGGFTDFREPSAIAGVIFAQVPASMSGFYAAAIRDTGLVPLGCLPHRDSLALPSRHLGLVAADEIGALDAIIAELGRLAEDSLDLDGLTALARRATPLPAAPPGAPEQPARVRLAVARDEAFCFTYAETLEQWQHQGCELVFFSPLSDTRLPDGTAALYLPGGYPENHLEALSANSALRHQLANAIEGGLPTIAECGGFMYLHRDIDGLPMVGVFNASAHTTNRLQRFGYTTLTAAHDNLLCHAGGSLPAHEFHYADSTDPGDGFTGRKASAANTYQVGHASMTMYAGFPHLYLAAAPHASQRFVDQARQFGAAR